MTHMGTFNLLDLLIGMGPSESRCKIKISRENSVTLVKKEYFFARAVALASLHLFRLVSGLI